MILESSTQKKYGDTGIKESELPLAEEVSQRIKQILSNPGMYKLPNKPDLNEEKMETTTAALARQYYIAIQNEEILHRVLEKIDNLPNWDDASLIEIGYILEVAPREATPDIMQSLRNRTEEIQIRIAGLALEKAPHEASYELPWILPFLSQEIREEVVRMALDVAPHEIAPRIDRCLVFLTQEKREEFVRRALEVAPHEAAPVISGLFVTQYLPEEKREESLRMALKAAPHEAAPRIMEELKYLNKETRERILHMALEVAPQEAAPSLIRNLSYGDSVIQEEIALLAFEKAPQEAAPSLIAYLRFLSKDMRKEVVRLVLEKAPQEAAYGIATSLRSLYLPEEIQEEVVRIAFEVAPNETAPEIMDNLRFLKKEIREEITRLALEKAPHEATPGIMNNLGFLSEKSVGEIALLAFEKAPYEAAPGIMNNMKYLPLEIQNEIKEKILLILRQIEQKELSDSETLNPALYKEQIEDLADQFSQRIFPKTGTRTRLLGGTLINNAILRIIPNQAFIGWMKAYSAVENWKEAGFNYVPIEPILNAGSYKDGRNVRVYAGVLGVSVARYLEMHTNREHHGNVKQQVQAIIATLEKMGIIHGHLHMYNFCILHERTSEGEIDWSKSPRVYCIDFDTAISEANINH